jgi:hypothetical protein
MPPLIFHPSRPKPIPLLLSSFTCKPPLPHTHAYIHIGSSIHPHAYRPRAQASCKHSSTASPHPHVLPSSRRAAVPACSPSHAVLRSVARSSTPVAGELPASSPCSVAAVAMQVAVTAPSPFITVSPPLFLRTPLSRSVNPLLSRHHLPPVTSGSSSLLGATISAGACRAAP